MTTYADLTEEQLDAEIKHIYAHIDSVKSSGFLNRRTILDELQIDLDMAIATRNSLHEDIVD